ncbi:MAG TPA: hypothetical protein PKA20_25045 [Burkholderiaceae bacterium]|nr:hypothetical protein [Burkholderiaceae bacterium]
MLLPFDTSLNFWLMAVPQYEWLPQAPPDTSPYAADSDCPDPPGADDGPAPPAPPTPQLQLVMTGVEWLVVLIWTPRDNPFWEQVAQTERDRDDQRNETRATPPHRRFPTGDGDTGVSGTPG